MFGTILGLAASAATLTPADFEITSLPGLASPPRFKQYSGLVPIGDGHGTELFFWFVESAKSPSDDPLVFWTNGGPGASSVAYGFWTEHGPFRLQNTTAGIVPVTYAYSWNRIANVLYVEMPSGVGFSHSTDASKYFNITDTHAAADTVAFLKAWLEIFSSFKTNDFFVTGESYGGHYVPMVAKTILEDGGALLQQTKGFLIGNPGINSDWYFNVNEFAFLTYMWSHGLVPSPAYAAAKDACNWDHFLTNCSQDATHPSLKCRAAAGAALKYVPSPLDPYDVLAPTCGDDGADASVMRDQPFLRQLRATHGAASTPTYDPCLSKLTPPYMRRPDVLAAVHVPSGSKAAARWPGTPPGWGYNQGVEGEKQDIALLFPRFFKEAPHWRIAVVSGTADSAVPFIGTERWMECLGQPVAADWTAWKLGHDVAGMVKRWKPNLSLVTVKGCGHTIPYSCPEKGFAFFENYLGEA